MSLIIIISTYIYVYMIIRISDDQTAYIVLLEKSPTFEKLFCRSLHSRTHSQVSFGEEPYVRGALLQSLLQKSPIFVGLFCRLFCNRALFSWGSFAVRCTVALRANGGNTSRVCVGCVYVLGMRRGGGGHTHIRAV